MSKKICEMGEPSIWEGSPRVLNKVLDKKIKQVNQVSYTPRRLDPYQDYVDILNQGKFSGNSTTNHSEFPILTSKPFWTKTTLTINQTPSGALSQYPTNTSGLRPRSQM